MCLIADWRWLKKGLVNFKIEWQELSTLKKREKRLKDKNSVSNCATVLIYV